MGRGRGGRGRRGGYTYNSMGRTSGRISQGQGSSWVGGGRNSGSSSSMAWVRPKGDGATTSAASSSALPTATSERSTILSGPGSGRNGPILRGPRQHHGGRFPGRGRFQGRTAGGRGRGSTRSHPMSPVPNNTWRRSEDTTSGDDLHDETNQPETVARANTNTNTDGSSQFEDAVEAAANPATPSQLLLEQNDEQRAQNTNDGSVDQFADALEVPDDHLEPSKKEGDDGNANEEVMRHEEPTMTDTKKKEGTKMLAREPGEADKDVSTSTDARNPDTNNSQRSAQQQQTQGQGRMIQKGSNKLILSTKLTQQSNKSTVFRQTTERTAYRGRGHKRPMSPRNNGPTVKRIKIHATESADSMKNNDEKGEETNTSGDAKGKNSAAMASNNETLTDFAYRETFSNRGRGGRVRSARGVHPPPHMGLVRVNPDERNTPICPTFLRGIRCENERCRKRHDVPIESARPVCSFFQRHGQCLKGSDCPFRHVKVNARAMLCPSFNLLGYCDDKKCVMKHVAANKSIKNVRSMKTGHGVNNRKDSKS